MSLDPLFPEGGVDDDSQFFQERLQVHAGGLIGGLPQVHAGDFFQGQNQSTQRFEVFIISQRAAAGQVFMHHGDSAADVANLVRNGAHQNPRTGQQTG